MVLTCSIGVQVLLFDVDLRLQFVRLFRKFIALR